MLEASFAARHLMRPSLLCAAILATIIAPVAHADLVAFYSFDNDIDPFEDTSGNANHISASGGPDGPIWDTGGGFDGSGGYEFTGDGDHLVAPVDINPAVMPQMTWGAWVRTNSLVSGQRKFKPPATPGRKSASSFFCPP